MGLPNVGKSTLFNVLTKMGIPAENFPFCTIDPNAVRGGSEGLFALCSMGGLVRMAYGAFTFCISLCGALLFAGMCCCAKCKGWCSSNAVVH